MRYLVISESGHIETAIQYASDRSVRILAIGAEIEFLLGKVGIAYRSARDLRTVSTPERLEEAEHIGREALKDKNLEFFSYRDVSLSDLFLFETQIHLGRFLYYVDIAAALIESEANIDALMLVKTTLVHPPTSRVLADMEAHVVEDAFDLVARQRGIVCEVIEIPRAQRAGMQREVIVFMLKRWFFGLGIRLYNILVAMFRPVRKIRLLASETWKNIGSLIDEMPESELILVDRSEIQKIGLRRAWYQRMRFIHLDDFGSRRDARRSADELYDLWKRATPKNTSVAFRGYVIDGHVSRVIERVVAEGGPRAIQTIDGAYRVIQQMQPDAIVLRASISAQIHFPVLAYVGRILGVPVIEEQHGLRYLGLGSFEKKYPAEYLATYGPIESASLRTTGHEPDKVVDIGSARFDILSAHRDTRKPVRTGQIAIACIIHEITPGIWNDGYDVVDFLMDTASIAERVPNAYFLLRIRPDTPYVDFFTKFIREHFAEGAYEISSTEPIVELFKRSDMVIAYYSTVILEAFISNLPTIFLATQQMQSQQSEDFRPHESFGALRIARSRTDLADAVQIWAPGQPERLRVIQAMQEFLKREYRFDGSSSKRLADMVRGLVSQKS